MRKYVRTIALAAAARVDKLDGCWTGVARYDIDI